MAVTQDVPHTRRTSRPLQSVASSFLLCAGIALGVTLAMAPAAAAEEAGRPGEIQFSNGETQSGIISLTPDSQLQIHTGKELRSLALEAVREIRIEPESEKMEQKWRFVEAGRVEKEKWGQPYPVRSLRTILVPNSGSSIVGHLYTTVLYVEVQPVEGKDDAATKVVLLAKQRGKEGETFADLVYPVRIAFADPAQGTTDSLRIQVKDRAEVMALTYGTLTRLAAEPVGQEEQRLPSPLGAKVFAATRVNGVIRVGWPVAADAELRARIEKRFGEVRDFFDQFRVLGVQADGEDVYALVMASRTGRTTLHAEQSQPWRLEIWRWKLDGDNAMVAGRGYFFRGILEKGAEPPSITLDPALWNLEFREGMVFP
jgi:hypothetical protein